LYLPTANGHLLTVSSWLVCVSWSGDVI